MMNKTLTATAAVDLRNALGLPTNRAAWDASGHSMCRSFAVSVKVVDDAGEVQNGSIVYVTDDGTVGVMISYSPFVVVERPAADVGHHAMSLSI